jgi:hypothetical protein
MGLSQTVLQCVVKLGWPVIPRQDINRTTVVANEKTKTRAISVDDLLVFTKIWQCYHMKLRIMPEN